MTCCTWSVTGNLLFQRMNMYNLLYLISDNKSIVSMNKYVWPIVLDQWQEIYCFKENDKPDIFKQLHFRTRETILQRFHYNILYRTNTRKNGYITTMLSICHHTMCKIAEWMILFIILLSAGDWIIFCMVSENWWNSAAEYN